MGFVHSQEGSSLAVKQELESCSCALEHPKRTIASCATTGLKVFRLCQYLRNTVVVEIDELYSRVRRELLEFSLGADFQFGLEWPDLRGNRPKKKRLLT